MKNYFGALCLITTGAFAQVGNLDVQELNFIYNNPVGSGTVSSFTYEDNKDNEGLVIEIEKIASEFKVLLKGEESREFYIKNAPDFILNSQTIDIRNLNANSYNQTVLNLNYGLFTSKNEEIELKDFKLNCDKTVGSDEDAYILGCIQKMNLNTSQFSSDSESLLKITQAKSLSIKNVDMRMTVGKYELSAVIKAQISGTAKAKGYMSYDQESKVLSIKISEVKLGFLDVTSRVFDELKKQENEKIKVEKPYVYYSIK